MTEPLTKDEIDRLLAGLIVLAVDAAPADTDEDRAAWLRALIAFVASAVNPLHTRLACVESEAEASESAAWRAGWARFVKGYAAELLKRTGLQPLASSTHIHRTLLMDTPRGDAVVLTATFQFADLCPADEIVMLAQGRKVDLVE